MVRFLVCVFVALTLSKVDAAAITNTELLDMLKENSEADVQEYLIPNGDEVASDDDDDVIDLPGNPEDEADIETLVDKLGLLDINGGDVRAPDDPLVGDGCSCHPKYCTCCIGRKVTVTVLAKKISTIIYACVTVRYVPSNTDFLLTFALNNKTVYHKEVSLNSPPKVCAKMSGTIIKAFVCLDIYNVNLSSKSLCTRLIGLIDFRIKKVYFAWGIACFRIPKMSSDWLTERQETLPSAEPLMTDDDVMI